MNVYAGPPRAITRVTLRLVPLTPVHIGDGTEMRLDEYLIHDPAKQSVYDDESTDEPPEAPSPGPPMLCRFDQAAAMRAMNEQERAKFTQALNGAKLGDAAAALRKAGERHILERIPLSAKSKHDLRHALANPESRTGQVKPFVRSAGRPYIPGSSIKGALRTALASAALPRDAAPSGGWRHESALSAALGLDPNDTATDPLRFLHVSDAMLPEGATLVDRAEVVKRPGVAASSSGQGGGIQMHYERSRALTDRQDAPAFEVQLGVDARASGDAVRRDKARFSLDQMLARCRDFHVNLFNAESNRFFADATKANLTRLLTSHQAPDGQAPYKDKIWAPGFVLLRLGRFGHFESKSLEGVRRGHFPQAKNPGDKIRPPGTWGVTRTITRDAKDNPIPFGWVIGWVVKQEGK